MSKVKRKQWFQRNFAAKQNPVLKLIILLSLIKIKACSSQMMENSHGRKQKENQERNPESKKRKKSFFRDSSTKKSRTYRAQKQREIQREGFKGNSNQVEVFLLPLESVF